jgi:23S rRNA (pseudouridine1915-N3)-methyltransferase
MRIRFVWVGHTRNKHLRALQEEYLRRLRRFVRVEVKEVRSASGRRSAAETRRKEGKELLATLGQKEYGVGLDSKGRAMTTQDLAQWFRKRRDGGVDAVCFLVGGEEGLADEVLGRASLRLSLGPMTLPHELARVVLVEQVYRAFTLLAGHPYSR